jgi:histidinol phosphatase-like PHP family hydrolase
MVQDVLQKLNSIGADFIWIFAVYQEQMRINKGLKDEITNVSASHELLRQTYDLAEQKITSLESLLYHSGDDESDAYTDFSSGSATEEKIKDQQEEISYLKAENRRIELQHGAEISGMAEATQKYEEALARASDLVITSAKRIAELEARMESEVTDQNCDFIKSENTEA